MLNDKEIALWISRLETEDSSWANYEKLAVLYTIKAHQNGAVNMPQIAEYSAASAPVSARADVVGDYGDSDFLRTVAVCNPAKAWSIMDELMSTLEVVNPRAYNSVMRKLEG